MAKLRTLPKPQEEEDEKNSYAIAKILEQRVNNEQLEYLIEWKDRPASENSWQAVTDLYSKKKSQPFASPVSPLSIVIVRNLLCLFFYPFCFTIVHSLSIVCAVFAKLNHRIVAAILLLFIDIVVMFLRF